MDNGQCPPQVRLMSPAQLSATRKPAGLVSRLLLSEYFVLWLSVLYFLALAPFTPGFASLNNLTNVLATLLPLFVVALGQTVVLITGGIDLSVGSICALLGILLSMMLVEWQWPATVALPAVIAVGGALGAGHGLLVTRLALPPFIVTLCGLQLATGIAVLVSAAFLAWSYNAGWKTAVIERLHVGGTCINVGCTPTKTMVASARVAYLARRAADYGVHAGEVLVNMVEVRQRKQSIVDSFRGGSQRAIENTKNLDLLFGEANFTGPVPTGFLANASGPTLSRYFFGTIWPP